MTVAFDEYIRICVKMHQKIGRRNASPVDQGSTGHEIIKCKAAFYTSYALNYNFYLYILNKYTSHLFLYTHSF